jgi:hypothetical protein
MNTLGASLICTILGAFMMGLVHNPNIMAIGLCLLAMGQALMFYTGFKKGRAK